MSIEKINIFIYLTFKSYYPQLGGNYTRMQQTIFNKSWRQHPTKQQLYGHTPHITKTIQVSRTRHTGHCWRSMDELISDILLWTPSHGRAKAGRPAGTYIQLVCADTGGSLENLPDAMDDNEGWWERVRGLCADGATWWWWSSGVNQNVILSIFKSSWLNFLLKFRKTIHFSIGLLIWLSSAPYVGL